MKPTEPTPEPGDEGVTAACPEGLPDDRGAARLTTQFIVSDHELLRRIGSGAYGDVWLARNVLGELRAVKVIHRSRFNDERPFEREFEGIQRFEPISRSHPSQLAVLHVGKNAAAGCFYYVMELADSIGEGDSRSEMGDRGKYSSPSANSQLTSSAAYAPHTLRYDLEQHLRLPIPDCVQIGLSLTTALAHLHQHGLVHRDIKPSNVIFVNGVPKLGDIGLVTESGDTQSIVGTEGYLPPEGPGTPQADIFSLGKVLYEISTGLDRRRFAELPEDLRSWPDRKQVVEFNEIVLKACAKDPARRYQSADEMQADMALLQRGKSVKRKRAFHHWLAVSKKVGLAVLLLSMVVAVAVILRQSPRDPYVHSAIPEVNSLVTQGFTCVKTPGRIGRARDYFNKAIELDPGFVPAYRGLCQAAINEGGMEQDDEAKRKLREVAAKLMKIAPSRTEARIASSCVKWVDWDFPGARADAQLATRMQATCLEAQADAHGLHGYLLLQSGQPEQALVEYRMAERLDPAMSRIHHHLGHPYFAQRKFDEALKHYQKAIDFQPNHTLAHFFIGCVYQEKGIVAAAKGLGDEEEKYFMTAIREFETRDLAEGENEPDKADRKAFYDALREAVRVGGAEGYWKKRLDIALEKSQPDLYYIATLYARLGDKPKAYAYLKEACDKQAFDQGLMFDLCWDHDDPEFIAIAKGIGLLQ